MPEDYQIRDNQFWYSRCSFAEFIHDKQFITIRVSGCGDKTFQLKHAAKGRDGRIITSFKFIDPADRQWWEEHNHRFVQIELLAVDGKEIGTDNIRPGKGLPSTEQHSPPKVQASSLVVPKEIKAQWERLRFPEVSEKDSFTWTGFDSAWAGRTPGAIAWMTGDRSGLFFKDVQSAYFDDCLEHVNGITSDVHLLMIDQPTIVKNDTGRRPVEAVISHEIGRAGGGVQPAYLENEGMFGEHAPIWPFLKALQSMGFKETTVPLKHAPTRKARVYLETFPALGNLGLFGYTRCPKYNPSNRRTFNLMHWQHLCSAIKKFAETLEIKGCLTSWAAKMGQATNPTKAEQDQLDALLCTLVGYIWWRSDLDNSVIIGEPTTGYMVIPCFREDLRATLKNDAARYGLLIDVAF